MAIYKRKNRFGHSYYCVDFRLNGKRYRQRSPENTLAGAKAFEVELRHKLTNEEPKSNQSSLEKAIPTLEVFSSQWIKLDAKNNNKPSEVENKISILKNHILPFFGHKNINQITSLDVEHFKNEKRATGLTNKTINNFLIVLSRCLKMAQEWDITESTPKIKLLKVPPQKFNYLTVTECLSLLNNANGLLKIMILVALKTGLRFGELIALEWDDVNFSEETLTVKGSFSRGQLGSTKGNKIRYIPLLPEVIDVLKRNQNKNRFVFSEHKASSLSKMKCYRWLQRARKQAGLRNIGWHTLRHTFASHLAQNNTSGIQIQELLGHVDIRTTMRYSHLNPLSTREAVNTLASNIGHNLVTTPDTGIIKPTPILLYKTGDILKAK